MSWVIVNANLEVAGPYTSWHKVKGVYDELRALDVPVKLVETRRWWELSTDDEHNVAELLKTVSDR